MTKVLGPLMMDLESTVLTDAEAKMLQRPVVGGVILFSRNFESPAQLAQLTKGIRRVRPEILIGVDQEGGRVQRFRDGFLTLPALRRIGELYEREAQRGLEMAEICGWAMAAEVLLHGIDFSFAPVLDLFNIESKVIAQRAFSADFTVVSVLAQAYIKGMNSAGMAATGKHFPGHGTVLEDSHSESPVDARAANEILETDYQAFARCIHVLGAIMPAHVKYPQLDEHCAGYSQYWIRTKLRQELGFKGVVFSDDLTMAAAHAAGSICLRADSALAAGCDMVLVCNDAAAANQVADYLEPTLDERFHESSSRLETMAARPTFNSELYSSQQWHTAKAAINTLVNDR